MKVKSIQITSFRGIDNLNLEFDIDNPTVIIGVNAVGKTTILDCLEILLSCFINEILGIILQHEIPQKSIASIAKSDVRLGMLHPKLSICLLAEGGNDLPDEEIEGQLEHGIANQSVFKLLQLKF